MSKKTILNYWYNGSASTLYFALEERLFPLIHRPIDASRNPNFRAMVEDYRKKFGERDIAAISTQGWVEGVYKVPGKEEVFLRTVYINLPGSRPILVRGEFAPDNEKNRKTLEDLATELHLEKRD